MIITACTQSVGTRVDATWIHKGGGPLDPDKADIWKSARMYPWKFSKRTCKEILKKSSDVSWVIIAACTKSVHTRVNSTWIWEIGSSVDSDKADICKSVWNSAWKFYGWPWLPCMDVQWMSYGCSCAIGVETLESWKLLQRSSFFYL